jgi:hypothetical protein
MTDKTTTDTLQVALKFQVQEINTLLTVLNLPSQAPTTTLGAFIMSIQNQVSPQIMAFELLNKEKETTEPVAETTEPVAETTTPVATA